MPLVACSRSSARVLASHTRPPAGSRSRGPGCPRCAGTGAARPGLHRGEHPAILEEAELVKVTVVVIVTVNRLRRISWS